MTKFSKYWDSSRDDYSDRPSILFQEKHINYLDDCKMIIDLGSGTGQLVKKLNNGPDRTCFGITYNNTEVANKIHDNVLYGDMQKLPFEDNSFDGFVMWDSLEHCPSAFDALCEANRVLKEGGKGLIFMPGQNWLDCHVHICCYTVPQMHQLFRQSKIRLVNTFSKKYPQDENIYCEGMAIYEVVKDSNYKPTFQL